MTFSPGGHEIVVDDSGRPVLPVEGEDNWFFVHELSALERTILMSDEVKSAPQLRIGLINEIMSEGIFIGVDHASWEFFRRPQFCSYFEMRYFHGTRDKAGMIRLLKNGDEHANRH
jgi:hypothetical protein